MVETQVTENSRPSAELPSGLNAAEAARRLTGGGYNELGEGEHRHIGRIMRDTLREPMFLLLIAAGSIYLMMGDVNEAMMLLAFVFIIIGLTVLQEYRTERVLETLRELSSPRALVIRDGRAQRIPGREVVPGDIMMLSEGDRVPADGTILSCHDLSIDEAMLTGESVPVRKLPMEAESAQSSAGSVYAGTLLVQGNAIVRVTATGTATELGKIGKSLQQVETETSPLQQETARLIRHLAIIGLGFCLTLTIFYIMLRGGWLDGLLAGITLAMALLPQEFAVILTIFMALGARRISAQNVLTRRLNAIETLGETTVLCVDKTGTLTQNRMSVGLLAVGDEYFYPGHGQQELPETFHQLLEYSILASELNPYDPMEQAFHHMGSKFLANTEHLHSDWLLVHEYELTPELLAMSHLWHTPGEAGHKVATKGAPEAIIDLCHMSAAESAGILEQASKIAAEGFRVLGVARSRLTGENWPSHQHEFDFEFLGLIGLTDPIRPEVPAAIQECYSAGIRVIMITGDYPSTAAAIAAQIGLRNTSVITGEEMDDLSDFDLGQRAKEVSVFARVLPQQKLRLVQVLKTCGEVVAMTGDGVNDAPALKAAHIGIAMGRRGTDVAREAAALVLLEDDFSAIVHAIRLGRRIYDNLRKAMTYTIAVHVPIVGLSILPVLFGLPLIFAPIHIVFMELVIDPACSIVFEAEAEEKNLMQRPPRPANEHLLQSAHFLRSILYGLAALLVVITLYLAALQLDSGEQVARSMAFITLVLTSIGLVLSNRTHTTGSKSLLRGGNRVLGWVVAGTLLGMTFVTTLAPFQELFRFAPLSLRHWIATLVAGLTSVLLFETIKKLAGQDTKKRGQANCA